MANLYPNIIQFYEVTKLKGEMNYSLVLEYAEGGTLGKYLREKIIFEWESQLKFAKKFQVRCHGCMLIRESYLEIFLGAIFWELTSCRSPFDFETKNNDPFEIFKIKPDILSGKREKPISGTDHKFITLYKKCWQYEPDERPDIHQVISEIINIEPINGQNFEEEIESEGKLDEYNNMPSCDDYDINSDKYKF
ncbi:hypothetical protein RclHR1_01680028 [Rhizophagus clarus]|uniref:Protein kinase domain-containing protein n=1 Tax=Rhizophagus clarus TaxID=94130 RepID=A0A2Z6QIN1_9GLOM|nr:hypothetical protein RclHR1_01680028 [Rhizophagus clarus]